MNAHPWISDPAPEQSPGGPRDWIGASPLTLRQKEVLGFVARFKNEQGLPPTLREVAEHFGFRSTTAAADHLRALRRKGYLTFAPRKARSNQPFPSTLASRPALATVPIFASIPGAEPHGSDPEGMFTMDPEQFGLRQGEPLYALRVRCESMEPQAQAGDILLFSRARNPEVGAVVATLQGGRGRLMTVVGRKGQPFLRGTEDSQLIPADEILIVGVMVGLVRFCARPMSTLATTEGGPVRTLGAGEVARRATQPV